LQPCRRGPASRPWRQGDWRAPDGQPDRNRQFGYRQRRTFPVRHRSRSGWGGHFASSYTRTSDLVAEGFRPRDATSFLEAAFGQNLDKFDLIHPRRTSTICPQGIRLKNLRPLRTDSLGARISQHRHRRQNQPLQRLGSGSSPTKPLTVRAHRPLVHSAPGILEDLERRKSFVKRGRRLKQKGHRPKPQGDNHHRQNQNEGEKP